jgi:hypothetical protein
MAHKYLHVTLLFSGPRPPENMLVAAFSLADDWLKYANDCWIIWTARPASDWFYIFKNILGPNDMMLIVGLDMQERNGWMPQWIWEWIDRKRQLGPPPPPAPPPHDLGALLSGISPLSGGLGLLGNPFSNLLPPPPPPKKK